MWDQPLCHCSEPDFCAEMNQHQVTIIWGVLVGFSVFVPTCSAGVTSTLSATSLTSGNSGNHVNQNAERRNVVLTQNLPASAEQLPAEFSLGRKSFQSLAMSSVAQIQEGRHALHQLKALETNCRHATQAIVVIDAGSSSTRPNIFLMQTLSCPFQQRTVIPHSIRQIATGMRHTRLREVLEKWLDQYAGEGWESRSVDSRILLRFFRRMLQTANEFFGALEENIVGLFETHLSDEEKVHVKALGVPVVFYSTGGVRDFHDWYRDGFFVALRHSINNFSNKISYKFFTNPELTRPITGAEEGLYAFLTLNHLTHRLKEESSFCDRGEGDFKTCRNDLAGVVEFGGTSAQVVFPLAPTDVLPSSVKAVNLQRERFLPKRYPSADVISVSFMHLGVDSSTGLFLKQLCSDEEFLIDGVCYNPCFFKGYQQACSAGAVSINHVDGTVTVSGDMRRNKLKPIATYCSETNPEIGMKAINELQCRENKIDPQHPLEERVAIEGCTKIVGTGDFDRCQEQVERILISPKYPLPANSEATSSGFESLGQVFKFVSTNAPMVVTGWAMVAAIRLLVKAGVLSSSFSGGSVELEKASKAFCAASVKVLKGIGPVLYLPDKFQEKLNSQNHDICKTLALNAALVAHMEAAEKGPVSISWEKGVKDEKGQQVAELGWQVGAILQQVLHVQLWSNVAYETGWTHNLSLE